jgi:hypothetical protein
MVRECGLTAYLLLREGLGVEARLVRLKNRGPWTHVGVLVGGLYLKAYRLRNAPEVGCIWVAWTIFVRRNVL